MNTTPNGTQPTTYEPKQPEHQRCETCRHWVRLGPDELKGNCRFMPPTVLARGISEWPLTHAKRDCCGQHEPLPTGAAPAEKGKWQPPTPAYMKGRAAKAGA